MTGVHRLEHIESFSAADLAKDDSIGAHTQRVLDQIALGDLPPSFNIGGPRFQPNHVRLL